MKKSLFAIVFSPLLAIGLVPSFAEVESVVRVTMIEPDPRDLSFAGPPYYVSHATRFGADISLTGYDALLTNPQDGRTSFYSLSRREKVNWFNISHFGDNSAFLLTDDEILIAGSTHSDLGNFARYDRTTGELIDDLDLGFSPVKMAAFGRYTAFFSFLNDGGGFIPQGQVRGYDRESNQILYNIKPTREDHEFIWMEADGDRIYLISWELRSDAADPDARLLAFDLRSGAEIFDVPAAMAFAPYTGPSLRRSAHSFDAGFGHVAVGSTNSLTLFDGETGAEVVTIHGLGRVVERINYLYPGNTYAGGVAVGDNRIYVQDPSAPGASQDAPAVGVYDFSGARLFTIPNGYTQAGIDGVNDFGGEMAVFDNRLLVGGQVVYDEDIDSAQPLVFDYEFSDPDGASSADITVQFEDAEMTAGENAPLAFTLLLNRPSTETVSATVAPLSIAGSTATAGEDYDDSLIYVEFAPGEISRTARVPITDDQTVEPNEEFVLMITSVSDNASIRSSEAGVEILSDDFDGTTEYVPLAELDVESQEPDATLSDLAAGSEALLVGLADVAKVLVFSPTTFEYQRTLAHTAGSEFGDSLDVDGGIAVIGAPKADSEEGEVVIVDTATGGVLDTLASPDTNKSNWHGRMVRIRGDYVAVGTSTPVVYLYKNNGAGDWLLEQTHTSPTGLDVLRFGEHFDLTDSSLVIGEPGALPGAPSGSDDARIYLYDLVTGDLKETILGESPLAGSVLAAAADDFVAVRNANLYRFDETGAQTGSDPNPWGSSLDGDYNGRVAVRTLPGKRSFFSNLFPRDIGEEVVLAPPVRNWGVGSFSGVSHGRSSEGGIPRHSVDYTPSTPPATQSSVSLALNSHLLVTNVEHEDLRAKVYQLPFPLTASVLPGSATEGNPTAPVTFQLSGEATEPVTIHYRTIEGGAKAGEDFAETVDSVTVPVGGTTATAQIPLIDDIEYEGDELFEVYIRTVEGAGIQDQIAAITLRDDETEADLPVVSISGDSFEEGEHDPDRPINGHAQVTLTLSRTTTQPVWVLYTITEEGGAAFGWDYSTPFFGGANPAVASEPHIFAYLGHFPPGETEAIINIPIIDDNEPEVTESFEVVMVRAINARLGTHPQASVVIPGEFEIFSNASGIHADPPDSGSGFGSALAMNNGRLLIGEGRFAGGKAALSDPDGSNFATLNVPSGTAGNFGEVVALNDTYALVGGYNEDRAVLFDTDGNFLREFPAPVVLGGLISPHFGHAVALADDNGSTGAMVSAPKENEVYVFDAATGDELRIIEPPDSVTRFGVVLSAEGTGLLVGSQDPRVFLYNWTTGVLEREFTVPAGHQAGDFGRSLFLSPDHVLIGAPNNGGDIPDGPGKVFVFDRASGDLERVVTPVDPTSEHFGFSLAVENGILFVGAPEDDTVADRAGSVASFDLTNGDRLDKFFSVRGEPGDNMGYAVAVEGGILAAGAPGTLEGAGSVFYFGSDGYSVPFIGDFAGWKSSNDTDGGLFLPLSIDSVLAFALDLDSDTGTPRLLRSLPRLDASGTDGLQFSFDLPENLRSTVRLELQRSTDLDEWTTVASQNGRDPWASTLPLEQSPIAGESRDKVSFSLDDSDEVSFWRIRADENPDD